MKQYINSVHTQFAVVTKDQTVITIGKSVIITPKPQCKEGGIKWFDDRKLIRKDGAM